MATADWIASGVFEEGANSSRHVLRCLIPTTLQQLLGAFSSPRQINGNAIPGSPGIDIGTAPYCYRLLLRLNPLTPNNTTCPVAPMQAPPTHQPYYHHHAAPPIPRRLPGQALYPIHIPPSFLACSEYLPSDTYATEIHKPYCNHYRPTPHPRRLPPSCLTHHPANHPQTNNSALTLALSKEEGEGGAARPPPQLYYILLPTTHPPVLKP